LGALSGAAGFGCLEDGADASWTPSRTSLSYRLRVQPNALDPARCRSARPGPP